MPAQLSILKNQHPPLTFAKGQRIYDQNEQGNGMYIVQTGAVALTVNGEPIRTVGPGEVFGEMALLSNARRQTAAVAETDGTQVIPISTRQLAFMFDNTPDFATQMMKLFTERLISSRTHTPETT